MMTNSETVVVSLPRWHCRRTEQTTRLRISPLYPIKVRPTIMWWNLTLARKPKWGLIQPLAHGRRSLVAVVSTFDVSH